jgi:hypothetical protein
MVVPEINRKGATMNMPHAEVAGVIETQTGMPTLICN